MRSKRCNSVCDAFVLEIFPHALLPIDDLPGVGSIASVLIRLLLKVLPLMTFYYAIVSVVFNDFPVSSPETSNWIFDFASPYGFHPHEFF